MVFGLNLLPQDNKFFELLCQTSELSNKSIHLLQALTIEEDRDKAFKLSREIEMAKHKAKEVTFEITELLCRALVTPFDHEDIHRLSRGMYKTLKICEKTQERLVAFQLRPFQNDFFKLTSNMVEASDVVNTLVKSLKTFKDIKYKSIKEAEELIFEEKDAYIMLWQHGLQIDVGIRFSLGAGKNRKLRIQQKEQATNSKTQ